MLINLGSKVNAIRSSFAEQPDLRICWTNIGAQKIDDSKLETYGIVITSFFVNGKDRRSRFFRETFLLADISMDVAFGMSFLILSNVKANFNN